MFAHFSGIYLSSTVYFAVYCCFMKNQPKVVSSDSFFVLIVYHITNNLAKSLNIQIICRNIFWKLNISFRKLITKIGKFFQQVLFYSKQLHPSAILPGFISGIMWGIAEVAWFVANRYLTPAISFPIVTSGPALIASLWGVVVFKEVRVSLYLLQFFQPLINMLIF